MSNLSIFGHSLPFRLIAPVFTLAAASLLYLQDTVPQQTLRNSVFDQFQRWHPRAYQDSTVRIVDIDDRSLAELGQWPWPRTQVAILVERLRMAGAGAIAFDVMFAEADRTSPRAMLRSWKVSPAAAGVLNGLPDHDRVLADALRGNHVVLGFAATAQLGRSGLMLPSQSFGTVIQGPQPERLPVFEGAIAPLPALVSAAAGVGAMTFVPDADGVVRRVPLLMQVGDRLLPSLAAEALRVARNEHNYRIRTDEHGAVEQIAIAGHVIPTTAAGEAWVHFTRPEPRRTLSAADVIAGRADVAGLRDAIVLIGTSAQGLQDLRFSPLGGIIPGVEVHAQMLEQTLAGQFLTRPAWARAFEALVILVGGLVLCALALHAGALASALLTLAVLATLNWGAWHAFINYRLLLDPLSATLVLALVYIVSSVVRHLASERKQRWVRAAFSRYVSPNLVEYLVDHPDSLQLGGRRQICSFVFTDLVGFTSMMEKGDAGEMVSVLNGYLEEMIEIAFRHEGTLDRIVGDAVAIMFSAPREQADHAARALACALEMHRFSCAYATDLKRRGIGFGLTRIGVHCGEVVVGNFGGASIFDYRALGDPVNTASRLEGLNQSVGTLVCVSEAIRTCCPDVPMRHIGKVLLKGKSLPLDVYEPLAAQTFGAATPTPATARTGEGGPTPQRPDQRCESQYQADYAAAFNAMAGQQEHAVQAFEALHARRPADGLVAYHLARLRQGEQGALLSMTGK